MNSRIEEAVRKKRSGTYNCAQAVACTYCDIAGVDHDTMSAVTSAFGTGMGNMEGTCGALIGAGVVIGMVRRDRMTSRETMKEVISTFSQQNGASTCRELKGIDTGCPLRSCNDCVADAARLLESVLDL